MSNGKGWSLFAGPNGRGRIPVLLLAAVLVLAAGRTGHACRTIANDIVCQTNLRQIYLASTLYAQDNDGRYPDIGKKGIENLDILIEKGYLGENYTAQLFQCPCESERIDCGYANGRMVVNDWSKCGYFYIPGHTVDDPPDTIILGDSKPRHPYGFNYVTINGQVHPPPPNRHHIAWMLASPEFIIGVIALLVGIYIGRKSKRRTSP